MIIAEHDGVLLRHATDADLPRVAEITIVCYAPIVASFIDIAGAECVQGIYGNPCRHAAPMKPSAPTVNNGS